MAPTRKRTIAIYAVFGPLLGGLLVAAALLLSERPPFDFLIEVVLTCLVFAFPFGLLAAISAGLAHVLLASKLRPAALIAAVSLVGAGAQLVTVFLIGNPNGLFESARDFLATITPAVLSAVVISRWLLSRK